MDMFIPKAVLQQSEMFEQEYKSLGSCFSSTQFSAMFDTQQRTMWTRWNPQPRPCFNRDLLRDLLGCFNSLRHSNGQIALGGKYYPLEYTVVASASPKIFNLGGDLNLFAQLIQEGNRAGLMQYGKACIDVIYEVYESYGLPVTTVCLVQGECLGGGFEAAIAHDVIVAEESARFGFPEILFNLFPGMGAYSFLVKRVGKQTTEELLTSGKIYTASDMVDAGIVDILAKDGEGEHEVSELIRRRQRNRNGYAGIAAARRQAFKIDYNELISIVEIWVDCALRLTPRDLKLMQRLVSKQNELGKLAQVQWNSDILTPKLAVGF